VHQKSSEGTGGEGSVSWNWIETEEGGARSSESKKKTCGGEGVANEFCFADRQQIKKKN